MGEEDHRMAADACAFSLRITLIAMTVIAALLFVFADWAMIPFTLSESMEELRPQFAHVLRIYAVMMPFIGLIDIGSSILESLRLAQLSMISSFIRNVIIIAFLMAACTMSMDAIFYSILVSEIIGGALMMGIAMHEFRKVTGIGLFELMRRGGDAVA